MNAVMIVLCGLMVLAIAGLIFLSWLWSKPNRLKRMR